MEYFEDTVCKKREYTTKVEAIDKAIPFLDEKTELLEFR